MTDQSFGMCCIGSGQRSASPSVGTGARSPQTGLGIRASCPSKITIALQRTLSLTFAKVLWSLKVSNFDSSVLVSVSG